MNRLLGIFWLLSLLLASCAAPRIENRVLTQSDPAAQDLLTQAQRAHGAAAFANLSDVNVRYEGRWASIGPRFQPVLVDKTYRGNSEERLLLSTRVLAQRHEGPAGVKQVLRAGSGIQVTRNRLAVTDPEELGAAALVADAYTLFLLGPHYFQRPGVALGLAGSGAVDGDLCDQVLAVLKPGFGEADEDRVLLSIDREHKHLRRVRMTLNGLESTRGAEVDVTFRDFQWVAGVLWPRGFDERIRSPFDLAAHRWELTGLDVNRGYRTADISIAGFKGKAAAPASGMARAAAKPTPEPTR
jgi:hypothetical protein